jgi:dihydroorotate dehydrogenase (NAD+) catalytic subunit
MNNKITEPNLAVDIGGIRMKNPVMVASGTFGYGEDYAEYVDLNKLGAVVVKGIRMEPTPGNETPRMVEVYGGLVNAIGLQGPGVDGFIQDYLPFLKQFDVPVIINIWGKSLEEYGEVAAAFDGVDGVDGLELNISCPNVKEGGIAFGTDPAMASKVISLVRSKTTMPLIPKLSPNVTNVAQFAKISEDEGADAISLINTLPAMVIDTETRRPVLSNVIGGLSGPGIKPVAIKQVWEASNAVSIPVIGMGGIRTALDAVEFIIAGATAVAVGTANFTDPTASIDVANGISQYLIEHDINDISELTGSVVIS